MQNGRVASATSLEGEIVTKVTCKKAIILFTQQAYTSLNLGLEKYIEPTFWS